MAVVFNCRPVANDTAASQTRPPTLDSHIVDTPAYTSFQPARTPCIITLRTLVARTTMDPYLLKTRLQTPDDFEEGKREKLDKEVNLIFKPLILLHFTIVQSGDRMLKEYHDFRITRFGI